MSNRDSTNLGVECFIPILDVANVPSSVRYYVDVLGL
jgi:hypothetical protein